MGAAYALIWYPDSRFLLDDLAHDDDDDVSMAARFSLTAIAHGFSGPDDATWCLAVADRLRPTREVPLGLVPAICSARRFSATLRLRDWHLLNSTTDGKQLIQFYHDHTGLLVDHLLWMDGEHAWKFDDISEEDSDISGRILLTLILCDPSAARLVLDQLLQDSKLMDSAIWLQFLLDACGGPVCPLADLKGRIVATINNPEGFVLEDDDVALFPVLVEDDFCLESIVKANAERIVSGYPHAIGKWIRSDVAPEVRALLAAAVDPHTTDPFLFGLAALTKDGMNSIEPTLPERYFHLDLGDLNARKRALFNAVARSSQSKEIKIDTLLTLARDHSLDDVCAEGFFKGMLPLIDSPERQIDFLLNYVKGEAVSPMECAAINSLSLREQNDALPALISAWREESRGDVLMALHGAIMALSHGMGPSPNLLSVGSAAFIGKRYGIEFNQEMEYFGDKEAVSACSGKV